MSVPQTLESDVFEMRAYIPEHVSKYISDLRLRYTKMQSLKYIAVFLFGFFAHAVLFSYNNASKTLSSAAPVVMDNSQICSSPVSINQIKKILHLDLIDPTGGGVEITPQGGRLRPDGKYNCAAKIVMSGKNGVVSDTAIYTIEDMGSSQTLTVNNAGSLFGNN